MAISPEPKNIKALVLDLDGTVLAPGSVLSKRTINTIKACKQKGLHIIIATGRAIEAAEPFRAPLEAEGPMIYYNGAVVADMPTGKLLKTTMLDKEAVDFCVDLSRDRGVFYQVFFQGGKEDSRMILIAEKDASERNMYYDHTGLLPELGDLKEVLRRPDLAGCIKSMFLVEPEVQAGLRPILDKHFGNSVYIAQTHRSFLEIMDAKASKGQGLKFVMECLSLKSEEIIAFGDEENDLPLFDFAGFSAAPSNAKDSVKAAADIVIGSNAEDGVAVFLEDFFMLR
jgi:hypothetical protein